MSLAGLERELRAALIASRNADGGWGYYRGKRSRLEPTAWALLALGRPEDLPAVTSTWLRPAGVPLDPGANEVNYTAAGTAAVVALAAARPDVGWLRGLLGSILLAHGLVLAGRNPEVTRQDGTLRGWAWVDRTFSWVEPTAWCLLALKRGRGVLVSDGQARARARIEEADRLLVDRVCAPGGWNYGNPDVLRKDLAPYVPTTALGVLALQGRPGEALTRSVGFLSANRLSEASGLALGLAAIALGVHGHETADLHEALVRQWTRTGFTGNLQAAAVALSAITGAGSGYGAFRVNA